MTHIKCSQEQEKLQRQIRGRDSVIKHLQEALSTHKDLIKQLEFKLSEYEGYFLKIIDGHLFLKDFYDKTTEEIKSMRLDNKVSKKMLTQDIDS